LRSSQNQSHRGRPQLGTLPHFSYHLLSRIALALTLAGLAIFPLIQIASTSVRASVPTFTATIVDNAYQPLRINITTGTDVIWTYASTGKVQHTVTSAPNTNTTQGGTPIISSGPLNPGQSFSYIFYKHGSYPIQCAFHPFMNELVNVTGSDVQPPSPPITTPSTDFTPYAIGGAIAAAILVMSAALFVRRRAKKQAALRGSRI
jgi:plastocyanin